MASLLDIPRCTHGGGSSSSSSASSSRSISISGCCVAVKARGRRRRPDILVACLLVVLLVAVTNSVSMVGLAIGRRSAASAAQLSLAIASAPGRRLAREAIVDANVHVWDTATDLPFPGGKPPESLGMAGAVDRLVELNKANSIAQTLVVQPINYKYDHRYVTAALKKYPEMLAGEGLLDLTRGPAGVKAQMWDLASQGYSAFRLNPALLPEGETLDSPIVDAVAETAAELKTPIAFLFFGGLHKFTTEAKAVVGRHPGCSFAIEQMGFFLQPATGVGNEREVDEASFTDLLGFSNYPNVYVKIAALYRLYRNSADELVPRLQSLFDRFGAERLMWGSDFPFALDHGGIEQSLTEIQGILGSVGVTEAQRASILGGTAQKLFFSGKDA